MFKNIQVAAKPTVDDLSVNEDGHYVVKYGQGKEIVLPNELMLATFLADYEAEIVGEPVKPEPVEPVKEVPEWVESLNAIPEPIKGNIEDYKIFVPPQSVLVDQPSPLGQDWMINFSKFIFPFMGLIDLIQISNLLPFKVRKIYDLI